MHQHHIDLYRDPELLAEGYKCLKNRSIAVYFDQLTHSTKTELKKIFNYLELNYEDSAPFKFQSVKLNGGKGDKIGYFNYSKVETHVTKKWEKVLGTKFRKNFAKKYIENFRNETLKIFGYDHDDIQKMIDELATSQEGCIKDRFDLFIGNFLRILELPMFVKKIKSRKYHGGPFTMHR